MKKTLLLGMAGMLCIASAGVAHAAQEGSMHMAPGSSMGQAPASAISVAGVVRQIKPEAGKIKIAHDPIAPLHWPAMTMDFRVKDKAMLKEVSAGDKITFELGRDASGLVITRIEKTAK